MRGDRRVTALECKEEASQKGNLRGLGKGLGWSREEEQWRRPGKCLKERETRDGDGGETGILSGEALLSDLQPPRTSELPGKEAATGDGPKP